MDDINVPVFAQAKLEYTKQLVDVLYMNMYDGIRSIYDDSKKLYATRTGTPIILLFRTLLEKVPKWNSEIIDIETGRIIKVSKCDWLDDLLTAVFISHTRILMSIGPNQNYNKINVTIPKTTTFVHKAYINVSREIWKNPYLFNENVLGHEYQRNMKQVEDIIKLTIEDTIRRQLPIKEILREHLESENEKATTAPVDLKMLMKELQKANKDTTKEDIEEVEEVEEPTDNIDDIDSSDKIEGTNDEIEDDSLKGDSPKPISVLPSFVTKEEDIKSDEPINSTDSVTSDSANPIEPPSDKFEDPYKDPNDPSQAEIDKATANIEIMDITEPVVEAKYDNTTIVSDVKVEDVSNKLNNMMSDLNRDIKQVTTDNKSTDKSIAKTPENTVIKLDETKPSIIKLGSMPKTTIIKLDETKPAFSFNNPLAGFSTTPSLTTPSLTTPSLTTPSIPITTESKGEVEDITASETTSFNSLDKPSTDKPSTDKLSTPVSAKDQNAAVMKEVIKIDKKAEQIDETETLDNFYSDLHSLSKTKDKKEHQICYTLFEDANENDE